jgi:hypothetical protein
MTVAILAALGSAVCYALTSVLHHRAAGQVHEHKAFDPMLLVRLLARPVWLIGTVAEVAAIGLHAVALGSGGLALVQPLLVGGLLFALPMESALHRRLPHRDDVAGVVLSSVALAVFLVAVAPHSGTPTASDAAMLGAGAGCWLVVAVCLLLSRGRSPVMRAVLLGMATGALYALAATLLKVCAELAAIDPLLLLRSWELYALVAIGALGTVLNHNAFQAGPMTPSLASLTITNPVVSIVIGMTVFHEQLATGGWRLVAAGLAAPVMVVGVLLVSAGTAEQAEEDRHPH